jgi:PAS domain S-box-containing protein
MKNLKQPAEALQESELHFRLLVDAVADYAIYMLDPNGLVSTWNRGAQRIKGYSQDEIIGKHFSQFYTPEDRVAGIPEKALAQARDGTPFEAEGWRIRKDGSRFWASVSLSAVRDQGGTLIGFAKVTRDVTERQQSLESLKRAHERLAQSQKLEMLGQLTGAIAHDFNNLLMVISANAQLLRRRLVDPFSLRAIESVELAASRGETLTRRLLTFARRQDLNPIVIDLAERLGALRDVLDSSAGQNIRLVLETPPQLSSVLVDVPEFELALVNLVVNARDAMPDGGMIMIVAENVSLTSAEGLDDLTGDFVSVRISDTGSGIDPEVLPRVFEPFFTTKGPEKGTGLGLSQVYGFARQSNGTVRIASSPEGTAVTIFLPRAIGSVVSPADRDQAKVQRGSDRILVVEDNREVQKATTVFLEELGYQVSQADNADAALDYLVKDAGIDLVLSDIVMEGTINGLGLAQRIRVLYPHIAVLLTSGYVPATQTLDNTVKILRKPYTLATLSAAVHDALDRAHAIHHS